MGQEWSIGTIISSGIGLFGIGLLVAFLVVSPKRPLNAEATYHAIVDRKLKPEGYASKEIITHTCPADGCLDGDKLWLEIVCAGGKRYALHASMANGVNDSVLIPLN